jgi:DivIVA domain-containing protein
MPLTPGDVSNKRFTPVRLREGYDMGEVDQFLDEVEAELERLLSENEDLRTKLGAAQGGGPVPASVPAEKAEEPVKAEEKPVEKAPEPVKPTEQIKVVTAAEASSAATRLLELATRNADDLVAEARAEAEQIRTDAQAEAERLQTETRTRTEKLDEDARSRAQNLDTETEARRQELLSDIEKEKSRLDAEVENLRAFEREYRSRLKSYFSEQLAALDGDGEGGELATGEGQQPKRLKAILGEDGEQPQG